MSQPGVARGFDDLDFFTGDQSIQTLHIDDDSSLVEMVSMFLERERDQICVTTGTSVEDGLEILQTEEIDCIISDYEMPGQNGLDFLGQVREERPDIPFILFTGRGDEEIASKAITAGVTEYLQKGTGTDQYAVLANRIENLVAKHRAEQEVFRGFQALESTEEGIGILDADGEYVYLNPSYAQVYDADRENLLGENWEHLYPEDEVRRFNQEILPELEANGSWTGQSVGLTTTGNRVREAVSLTQIEAGGHVCVVRDISDRVQRERKLHREQQFLEAALNSLDDLFYVFDADLNFVRWNDAVEDALGYSEDELREISPLDLFENESRTNVEESIDRVLCQGESVSVEASIVAKSDEKLTYNFTGVPVKDESEIIGVVGHGREI